MKLNGKLEFGGVSKSNSPIENVVIEHLAGGASGASLPANGGASTAAEGAGRMVYNSDTSSYWFFDGSAWEEVAAAGEASSLTDADGDTLVQVEESADEDKIRIDVGDTPAGFKATPNAFVLGADAWTVDLSGSTDSGAGGAGADVTLSAGNAKTSVAYGGPYEGGTFTINAGTGGGGDSGVGRGGAIDINAGNASSVVSGSGGAVTINAGDGGATGGNAGDVTIVAGAGQAGLADGGDMTLTAGSTVSGPGGNVDINAGNGVGATAGNVTIDAGDTTGSGNGGGSITLTAGDATAAVGGNVNLAAGQGGGGFAGGEIDLTAGQPAGTATGGAVDINAGTGGTTGGTGGAVTVTAGAGGGGATYGVGGAVDIDAGAGTGSNNGGGVVTINGGAASSSGNASGGSVTITGGTSRGTSDGGLVSLVGGTAGATGSGGGVAISGAAGGAAGGAGGYVSLTAGNASAGGAGGGPVSIDAGTGNTTGTGGAVTVNAGAGGSSGAGGAVQIYGGPGGATSGAGGQVLIEGGTPAGTGAGGDVEIRGASGSGNDGGDVILQGGEGAATDGTVIVRQEATDNAGELRFEDNTGGQYIGLKAAGTISSSFTLILPTADATVAEQALTSDMAGNLSFAGPYVDKEGGDTLGGSSSGTWTLSSGSTIAVVSGADLTLADAPVNATDAANKAYVDSISAGLDPKESVRVATDAALPAVTPAGAGVGKTLTADAVGVVTIDGEDITAANNFSVGDRILVKDQADAADNGIYTVTTLSAAGVALVLTRATDQDGSPSNEVSGGNFTFVEEGTTNQDTGWVVIADGTLDVDNGSPPPDITWSQFTGAGSFTAGAGIGQSGSTIYLDSLELSTITTAATVDHLVLNDDTVTPSGTDSGDRRITVANFLNTLDVVYNASGFGGNGLITRTAADTYTNRSIAVSGVGNEEGLTIADGDGAAGNPTLGLDITGNTLAGENVASGDLFLLYNTSDSANEAFTGTEVAAGLNGLMRLENLADVTADTTGSPEDAGGNVLAYDTSTNKYESQAIQYIESFTSSTSFTVNHNLGQKWCNVTVTSPMGSPATDEVIIPDSITFNSTTQLTVTVSPAAAVTVIVMGVPGVAVN